jgi:transposase
VEEKLDIVLRVLVGDLTIAAAARQYGLSEQTISNWKKQFIQGGREGLGGTARTERPSAHEKSLQAEIETLKAALNEARVQLRIREETVNQPVPFSTSKRFA